MGVSSLGGPFCLPFCNAVGHQRHPAHRVSQRELWRTPWLFTCHRGGFPVLWFSGLLTDNGHQHF